MVTARRKKRLIRTGLVLVLLLAGAAYYGFVVSDPTWFETATGTETSPDEDLSPLEETSPPTDNPGWEEPIAATSEVGSVEVEARVRAVMPEGLDDGVPTRRFTGEGALDLGSSLAAMEFGVRKIPNSAGYFGHVGGDLEVVYSGSGFAATFPQMAQVLEDGDWMFYDLETLSNPYVIQLGIGQLREIGLSDPRLGIALLNGAMGEPGDPGESVPLEIDLDLAIEEAADADLVTMLEMMRDRVHVSSIEAEAALDAEGRIDRIEYSLTYPAVPEDVSVKIKLDLTGSGAAPIEEPEESDVVDYAEFLKL